jgi:FkbM family methyltransferase
MNTTIPPKGIEVIPQTGQWVVAGDSHIGKWSLEKGTIITDPYFLNWVKQYLPESCVILDIGANVGDHTRFYLDEGHTVYAFEPNPLTFECLSHNCPEAHNYNLAASDSSEKPLRFLRLDNVGASRIHPEGNILVNPVVIDTMGLPAPQFIKIDVEGFEINVLRGLEKTIENHRPIVLCEINHGALEANGFTAMDIMNFFSKRGYATDTLYPPNANHGWEQFDCLFTP